MKNVLVLFCVGLFILGCVAPPVDEKKKKKDKEHPETNEVDQQVFDVEYKRYLQEVVSVLESDDDFRQRLMKADPDDIKSGKISDELKFVDHNVRSKLDELKRQELERLRQAAIRHYEEANGIDKKHMKIPSHVDHSNPHTFEAEDLKKLILQTTRELEDVDRQRKDEFKEYEMKKELEYEEQLKLMDEKNRVEAEKHHKQLMEKHNQHQPLHHPGSKQQLEQVWEEQDHMSPEDFNPKTFFHLHDLDGNGVWDANEVKALFKKELDKMYDPNAPEDDIRERHEEMERMREHVFNETDTNKDQLISFQEFLDQTKRQEFQRDEGWDPIDQQSHPVYSEDEYKQYAKHHEEEVRRMIEQGLIPRAPEGYHPMVLPPGAQVPPGFDVHPQQYQLHQQQGGHHPSAGHPQQHQMHPQQGGHHPAAGLPQQHQMHPQQGGHHPAAGLPQQHQMHPGQGQHPPQIQGNTLPVAHQGQNAQQHTQSGYHIPPDSHPNAIPHQQMGQQQYGQQQQYQYQPQGGQQVHYQAPPQDHPSQYGQAQQQHGQQIGYQNQPPPPQQHQYQPQAPNAQYHQPPNNALPPPASPQQQQTYQNVQQPHLDSSHNAPPPPHPAGMSQHAGSVPSGGHPQPPLSNSQPVAPNAH